MFYHLNDPSGRSLTMTDAEGDTAWQVVYDGYGAVLTGTIPVTLTQTLLDMPDGTTGLVHQGNGRYYDPALGRPLQPNPAGVPPTVPQALNRYAAAPMGQPGVFQSVQNTWNPYNDPFASNTGKKVYAVATYEGAKYGLKAYYNTSLDIIRTPIWRNVPRAVVRSQAAENIITNIGIVGYAFRGLIGAPPGSLRASFFNGGISLFEKAVFLNTRTVTERVIVDYSETVIHRLPAGRLAGRWAGDAWGLDLGIGLAIDIGYQAWLDSNDPYLTPSQIRWRIGVTAFGSGTSFVLGRVAGFAAARYFGLSALGLLGGPAGWVTIGAGLAVSILWDAWIAPKFIYPALGLNPMRNLAPLQS